MKFSSLCQINPIYQFRVIRFFLHFETAFIFAANISTDHVPHGT